MSSPGSILSRDNHCAEVAGMVSVVRPPVAETPETVMDCWVTPCPTPGVVDNVARVTANSTQFRSLTSAQIPVSLFEFQVGLVIIT